MLRVTGGIGLLMVCVGVAAEHGGFLLAVLGLILLVADLLEGEAPQ